jgi:PKD repeat protein
MKKFQIVIGLVLLAVSLAAFAAAQDSPGPKITNKKLSEDGGGYWVNFAANPPDSKFTKFRWEFEKFLSSDQQNPAHHFTHAGLYQIKLQMGTADWKEQRSYSITIRINEPVEVMPN